MLSTLPSDGQFSYRRQRMVPACRTAGEGFAIPQLDLTPSDVDGFMQELQGFHEAFSDCFTRREPREHFFRYPYSVTLFSPLSHAVFGATDRHRDCAVAPRPQARGSPQSYTCAGVTPLPASSATATP